MKRLSIAVLAAAAGTALLAGACTAGAGSTGTPPDSVDVVASASPEVAPTSVARVDVTTPTRSTHKASATSRPAPALPGLPLFPFTTYRQVREWQQAYRSGGHQPWHLDAGQTALAFTSSLGVTGVDQIVSERISGSEARVTVGRVLPHGGTAPAGTIRLARWGTGPDAPWEVLGTVDNHGFTITRPRAGSAVRSPLTVAGRITGVDESIRVEVRQPSSERPLGTVCCTPGGGEDAPWSTTVRFSAPVDPVLLIVATTGGHVADVERFVVTGVRSRR